MLAVLFVAGAAFAYAEGEVALTVQLNGETVATFTMDDLQQIAVDEGSKTYNFSAWNTYPTIKSSTNIQGPTVKGVLTEAGVMSSVKDTGTVIFTGSGYTKSLTGKQLFGEDRYYYPNANLVDHENGSIPEDSYEGAVNTPAVIGLGGDTLLCVGQVAPNEENRPLFVSDIAKGGVINVSTATAEKCSQITVDKEDGTLQPENTTLTIGKLEDGNTNLEYDKIYFTFESNVTPGYGCPIYNCGPKQDMEYKPVLVPGSDTSKPDCKNRKVVLKVRVKGYGKQDSTLQTFTYFVGDALTVKVDGVKQKSYATEDQVKAAGGTVTCSYSGANTYPTLSVKEDRTGIKVGDIITDATGLVPGSTLSNDALIKFTGTDGYSTTLTAGQLFADRYYYPNAAAGTDNTGGPVKAEAYEGKVSVPAIIDTANDNSLIFGQTEPNEQNIAEGVDGMLKLGQIEIDTNTSPAKCGSITEATPAGGSQVTQGQKITLPYPTEANKRDKICYAFDMAAGNVPGLANGFYNYSAYRYDEHLTNPPVLDTAGVHTLSVKVTGYGKHDSDVTTFKYTVVPAKTEGFKAASSNYNAITLTWNECKGASGYEIYKNNGSKYTLIKTITSADVTSYKDTGLTTKKKYQYKIRTLAADGEGGTLAGAYAEASATPIPNTPVVTLTAGTKKATVKWKKIDGANGYQVYRSTKQSSGFKLVKTIKKGSTVSFTNKKLKKGTTYYFKVRAYRTVSGKKVYSSYSAVKSVKVK